MNSGVFKYIKILSWVLMVLGVASLVYLVVMSAVKPEPSMEFISSVGAAEGAGMIITLRTPICWLHWRYCWQFYSLW